MLDWISKIIFKLKGWKIATQPPKELKKALYVVVPHNHNSDFFLGLAIRSSTGLNIGFLGKAELFRPPFGWFFRALGGTPVNRSKSTNFVQQVVETFNSYENLLISIAPEGTRRNVSKLKTGFYHMAYAAKVPIVMTGFDYPRKSIIFAEPFITSGDFEADIKQYFIPFFKQIQGFQKDWIKNYEEGKFNE